MLDQVRVVRTCLLATAIALLVVGLVSHTLVRHGLQIVPLVVAALLPLNKPWMTTAAGGILVHWVLIAVLIWLFLLHISTIANGEYSLTEIAMTIVMGGVGTLGAMVALSGKRRARAWGAVFLLGVAVQFAFLDVSYRLIH